MKYTAYILSGLAAFFLTCGCRHDTGGSYLIKEVKIYDGSGADPYTADIIIDKNIIKKIGKRLSCRSCEEIKHNGLSLAPGFIDVHAHLEPLPELPDAASALHMGVTTALGGPDGFAPMDLGVYLDSLERLKTGINVAYLAGHNSIREAVMQLEDRTPGGEELLRMKTLVAESMEDGAFGLSTGLKYLPGAFAGTEEIIVLSKEAASRGGIYTSHLREEGLGLLEGVREAIEIAEKAGIPVVLTHHKAVGLPMWGKSLETLAMVDAARQRGLDVMIDQYPYTASYTGLSVLIPPWAMEGGQYKAFAARCEDPALRDSIKAGIVYNILNDRGGGDLKRIQLAKFSWKPHLEGKTLYDWAAEEGLEPTAANGAELVIRAQLNGGAGAIYHAMSEEDVERIMQHPQTMIASDGRITEFKKGFPHPRAHGTFPRVIGRYARDKKILGISEAIRKMTSLPAARLGLSDRGLIREGCKADLVLFDENTIIDKATFENPHQYPEGIFMVFVNGHIALRENTLSPERYGAVLRGPAFKK
ncbi:MAG: amidohydrolase family protein [Sinomicrobium sp.]|nr:amidohydrolase family protein [Sinomicrobium sp.]